MNRAFFQDDIAHLLQGIYLSAAGLDDDEQRGFDLAIAAIAVAVGIKLSDDFARDHQSPVGRIDKQS